jgi:hypothetical protein
MTGESKTSIETRDMRAIRNRSTELTFFAAGVIFFL